MAVVVCRMMVEVAVEPDPDVDLNDFDDQMEEQYPSIISVVEGAGPSIHQALKEGPLKDYYVAVRVI